MSDASAQSFLDTTSPVRYQASRRVALVAMGTNAFLVIGQIAAGIIGHSQALVADGLHTLADLSTDLLVSEHTWDLCAGKFDGTRVGEEKVKGRDAGVVVFTVNSK